MKGRQSVLDESRNKGMVAGAATAGVVAAAVIAPPVVAAVAAVPAALFVYKWWKHRLENGIKF
jgi:hypothetical protein